MTAKKQGIAFPVRTGPPLPSSAAQRSPPRASPPLCATPHVPQPSNHATASPRTRNSWCTRRCPTCGTRWAPCARWTTSTTCSSTTSRGAASPSRTRWSRPRGADPDPELEPEPAQRRGQAATDPTLAAAAQVHAAVDARRRLGRGPQQDVRAPEPPPRVGRHRTGGAQPAGLAATLPNTATTISWMRPLIRASASSPGPLAPPPPTAAVRGGGGGDLRARVRRAARAPQGPRALLRHARPARADAQGAAERHRHVPRAHRRRRAHPHARREDHPPGRLHQGAREEVDLPVADPQRHGRPGALLFDISRSHALPPCLFRHEAKEVSGAIREGSCTLRRAACGTSGSPTRGALRCSRRSSRTARTS